MTSALIKNNTVIDFFPGSVPSTVNLSNGDVIAGGSDALIGSSLSDGSQILPATYVDGGPPQALSYEDASKRVYEIANGAVNVSRTWETPPTPPAGLTFLQFIALFTQAEQAAIVGSTDVQIRMFLLMAAGASEIALSDPQTEAGVNYLVSQGLLMPQRAAQIFANIPTRC